MAGEPRPQGEPAVFATGDMPPHVLTWRTRGTPPLGYRPSVPPSSPITPSITPSVPVIVPVVRVCTRVRSRGQGVERVHTALAVVLFPALAWVPLLAYTSRRRAIGRRHTRSMR